MAHKKAAEFFRGSEGYNCAQAVIAAWNELYGTDHDVVFHQQHGGGRAEDGLCGALYAALQISPEHEEALKKVFADKAGALKCRQIRQAGAFSCKDCVMLAASTLESLKNKQ